MQDYKNMLQIVRQQEAEKITAKKKWSLFNKKKL